MQLPVRVRYKSGDIAEVVAQFADFVDFERTWQRSVRKFEEELRLTDIAWLAWSGLTRAKRATVKFSPDWIEQVESCEIYDIDEATEASDNPLQ